MAAILDWNFGFAGQVYRQVPVNLTGKTDEETERAIKRLKKHFDEAWSQHNTSTDKTHEQLLGRKMCAR